jgi:hypothetical protein
MIDSVIRSVRPMPRHSELGGRTITTDTWFKRRQVGGTLDRCSPGAGRPPFAV